MLYSPAAAYYAVRPAPTASIREVLREVEKLPRFSQVSRLERRNVFLGVVKEHRKCHMVYFAQKR